MVVLHGLLSTNLVQLSEEYMGLLTCLGVVALGGWAVGFNPIKAGALLATLILLL